MAWYLVKPRDNFAFTFIGKRPIRMEVSSFLKIHDSFVIKSGNDLPNFMTAFCLKRNRFGKV
jgi:hypothetical protein